MAGSVTKAMAASNAGAFLKFLSQRPEVTGTKVGTTGYCMGGGLSLTAATQHPDRIAAAASFHGGHLASEAPDSPPPNRRADHRSGVCGCRRDDEWFPPEEAKLLEDALTDAGVDHMIETYRALHGFAVPDNPTYDRDAATRHWRALGDLFSATLSS